jgi:hypothetical protein
LPLISTVKIVWRLNIMATLEALGVGDAAAALARSKGAAATRRSMNATGSA